jgi:hypothetical protein
MMFLQKNNGSIVPDNTAYRNQNEQQLSIPRTAGHNIVIPGMRRTRTPPSAIEADDIF